MIFIYRSNFLKLFAQIIFFLNLTRFIENDSKIYILNEFDIKIYLNIYLSTSSLVLIIYY
jgi:hypothetical protein